jgi:hypothetical protein
MIAGQRYNLKIIIGGLGYNLNNNSQTTKNNQATLEKLERDKSTVIREITEN